MHLTYLLYVLAQEELTPQKIAKFKELFSEAKQLVDRLGDIPIPSTGD